MSKAKTHAAEFPPECPALAAKIAADTAHRLPPAAFEAEAEGLQGAGEYGKAYHWWTAAAGVTLGHKRAERYQQLAEHCLREWRAVKAAAK